MRVWTEHDGSCPATDTHEARLYAQPQRHDTHIPPRLRSLAKQNKTKQKIHLVPPPLSNCNDFFLRVLLKKILRTQPVKKNKISSNFSFFAFHCLIDYQKNRGISPTMRIFDVG